MKKVAIFTTTRAEFGLIANLIEEIKCDNRVDYLLFVGGSHLAKEYGNTIEEINESNFIVSKTFDFLLNENSCYSIAKSDALASYEIAGIFDMFQFDYVIVLGDRHELLPIVQNAILYTKPIFHIAGGQKTEGVIDEQIRHMVTKASHMHFVACKEYASVVRHLGEEEWRIINSGALGVDSLVKRKLTPKFKLFQELGLKLDKRTVLMTYHPVTLEFNTSPLKQVENIFAALDGMDLQVIITGPNFESDRDIIMDEIIHQVSSNHDYKFYDSLGAQRYLSLLPHCEFVVGNSSSGLIEVPYFRIPTLNIGDRQKGRLRHNSIIDCNYDVQSIIEGINKASTKKYKESIREMPLLFGDGSASRKIVDAIIDSPETSKLLLKKIDFPNI